MSCITRASTVRARSQLATLRQGPNPSFDFGVTVRAEQDALAGLDPSGLQRAGHALRSDREALPPGIDVVEVQRPALSVVAAYRAAPAGLRDE